MRRVIPFLIIALGCGAASAQTYKWVDERGVTTYGTKPPAGRAAQAIDARAVGTIDTGADAQLRRDAEARRRAEAAQPVPPAPAPAAAVPPARGMGFDTYIRLQEGMTEGELLSRAGPPDHASTDALRREITKSFYYYPTTTDPFVTVVTLRGGRISAIERTKRF